MTERFVPAIAACLAHGTHVQSQALIPLVEYVFSAEHPGQPTRAELEGIQAEIRTRLSQAQFAPDHDKIALVYGGATKIKGYKSLLGAEHE